MAHLESLVVLDPQRRSRDALTFGFERAGYSVYSTEQGADALAMAQTRVVQLLVVSAQQSDALGVVGRLREDDPTRELPIVVLGERDAREGALRAGADEFVARPAFIRDVVTLAKLAVAVRQDGDSTGVVGMLEDYGLYFLTRALGVAGRSGVLELERGRRQGEVHFVQGQVVSARAGKMTGLPAFLQLLLWTEASMHLRFETPAGERKLTLPIDELLAQGAGFVQEFERLAHRIGGPQAVYRQAPTKAAHQGAKIPPEVLGLVKLFDGKRPLVDVAEDSPFKPVDTIKITYRLADLAAIERVDGDQVESPMTAQLAVRDWLLGAGGGPERSTVTEAGRRAAEAYAAEAARRAAEPAPSADLFGDTDRAPRVEPEEITAPPVVVVIPPPAEKAAPKVPLEEMPTAPREAQRGPEARNKKRNKQKPGRGATPGERAPAAERPSPPAEPMAPVDDHTIPFSKISVPPPAPVVAAKPAHKLEAHRPEARKHEPHKAEPHKRDTPTPGKLSAQAAAGAHTKEPIFDDVEEDFFAEGAELHKESAAPVDTFDDLDSKPNRKVKPRRSWFSFGTKEVPPPAPPPSVKKR